MAVDVCLADEPLNSISAGTCTTIVRLGLGYANLGALLMPSTEQTGALSSNLSSRGGLQADEGSAVLRAA
jgi:hypothetical protein